jgi:hypothetical protein
VGDCRVGSEKCLTQHVNLFKVKRAIYGRQFDYLYYEPTDAEMGIHDLMRGNSTDLQFHTLGDDDPHDDHQEADLSDDPLGDPCVTIDAFVEKKREDFAAEKPICYDCPSELWCGDCPDSERCSDSLINCRSCPFEEGCLNEVPAGLKELELDFEVTDKPLSDIPNDVESFAGMNAPVVYPKVLPDLEADMKDIMPGKIEDSHIHPLPAEQLEDGSWLMPTATVAVLAKDLATAPSHLTDAPSIAEYINPSEDPHDEAYEGDDAEFELLKEHERFNPHMLNGYPEDPCRYPQDVQEAKAEAQQDLIDHPSHYAKADIPSGIECWDWYELAMTEEEFIGHMKGNVLKYVFRAGRKEDGAQDLEKAGAYLKRWLSYLDGDRTVHMKGKKNDG